MANRLSLAVIENGRTVFNREVSGTIELGRQRSGEPEPYQLLPPLDGPARLLVAHKPEGNVSRQHALLEITPSGEVKVTNLSRVPLDFDCGPSLAPDSAQTKTPPFSIQLVGRSIRVDRAGSIDSYGLRSLEGATIGPGSIGSPLTHLAPPPASLGSQSTELLKYLRTALGALQSAIGSTDFMGRAIEALVNILRLDSGRILQLENNTWKQLDVFPKESSVGQPSRHLLESMRELKKPVWQDPTTAAIADEAQSLAFVQTAIAAPLLSPDERVIGALYGERGTQNIQLPRPVTELEVMLVELLACGVAAGLARHEQERELIKSRVRFEQFFTRELALHLAREPNLLDGRKEKVTLLFCDIRGFSRISESLEPEVTVQWVNAVMNELSAHVLAEGGVLVDYIGDEMVAMWGAPQPQMDHAERATRAALACVEALPKLNAEWQEKIGGPMDLGIGLNSGFAHVGNTGSKNKFKYGPLGNTVNLASRVQGITKYLKCNLLVTKATRDALGDGFKTRRVCRVRVVNIAEPVDLYEVQRPGGKDQERLFNESVLALEYLEKKDFEGATLAAGVNLAIFPGDGPLRLTLSRASKMLIDADAPFDPVWIPPGK